MSEEKKIGGRAFGETLNAEKFIASGLPVVPPGAPPGIRVWNG